ncbi:hydantoinase/oxoprolinase family protein [Halorarum halobium]|uniref:hydantoinase/oxoprolinase family protein n=1 Tax=Halorarum halobium TaxID=3075121 RepID=UPI0028A7253C|nr:hydantoinase/oxoprolinase family protein [Halobaculum sp. XH14]
MNGYRLGIDVGGTNTDAVILDEDDSPITQTKRPTTEDITTGIVNALDDVLDAVAFTADELEYVMLGTTHATNAITERRGLNDVGVIRLGAPATESVRPLLEWPDDLEAAIGGKTAILDGGHEFDGRTLNDLDEAQVRETVREFGDADSFAVTSVFSPVREDHEERVAELIHEELGEDVPVSLSNEIGSVGLLERENATTLNAALTSVADEAASAFLEAMDERGIEAQLYFGQNDGTLMSVEYALEYPIFTVASGPSNSVRGAAYLSGVENGIIVDVGGTTTDVGAVTDGFPRESSVAVEIGDVKTNFRMPDLISIGIGGGSHVTREGDDVTVGPQSVGYRLTEESRCFGGETLTATDVEVASGSVDIGPESPDVDAETIEGARSHIRDRVEQAVDRMKTSPEPVPVVVVGGGSILVPADLEGASEVYMPDHYEVANAVGVAIAQVSGQVDRIFSLDDQTRDEALETAKSEATENAVGAGAAEETVDVVDVEEVPLSYLPGNAVRIKVKAAGTLGDE